MQPVTLYKKDSTGSVRIWKMEIQGENYRTIAGKQDGKQTISEWTTATPKNIGKENQTTGAQQAEAEVHAAYTKKLKTGYHYTLDAIGTETLIKPMLAEKWDDRYIIEHGRFFSQPKFDGFRCIATKDGLFSRKGEPFVACPHIIEALKPVFEKMPDLILDGELYNHDLKDDFNKIASIIRKQKPTTMELLEAEKVIQYHIYDIVDTTKSFSIRDMSLAAIFSDFYEDIHPYCVPVKTIEVKSKDMLDALYGSYIDQGYEGQMVRMNGHYQNKRSGNLMKRKEFQDAEFKIIAIEEGLGNRSGMAGRVTLALGDDTDRTFGAGIKGGVKVNQDLWDNRPMYIGQLATIEFFAYTPDGIPRFPVFKTVRTDTHG